MKIKTIIFVLSLLVSSSYLHAAVEVKKVNSNVQVRLKDKINLNRASASSLINTFKGVGKKRAEEIVKYRQAHGNFKSVSDLSKVRGFSKKFITKNLVKLNEVYTID